MKVLFILIFLASFAKAHPVIYKDGFVYWGEFSSQKNTQIISYTFHPRLAFQLSSDFRKSSKNSIYQMGFNFLVKRWFLKDSQANIYTSLQAGVLKEKTKFLFWNYEDTPPVADRLTFQWNIDIDWESRSIYTASKFSVRGQKSDLKFLGGDFSYRIGFAPYVVGMDALQTWLIVMFQASGFRTTDQNVKDFLSKRQKLKSQYKIDSLFYSNTFISKDSSIMFDWKITPLLRFFYKNVLWEIGSSLQSDFYLTLMVHY